MPIWVEEERHNRPPPPKPAGAAADWFGYVPEPVEIEFDGGVVHPAGNYDEIRNWVQEHRFVAGNSDGILFPPVVRKVQLHPVTQELIREVPNSNHPATIYHVPATHGLRLNDAPTDQRERRLGIGGFVMHAVGYLFDTRQQFHDWWLDAAIPIGRLSLEPHPSDAGHFVSHALARIRAWQERQRRHITNLLYMHCRASSHQWYWERFMAEYIVTDSCYCLAKDLGHAKSSTHGGRIVAMCGRYGIRHREQQYKETIERIVKNRNKLFHEALWEGEQPSGGTTTRAVHDVDSLHRLNQRLICGLLDYDNVFRHSGWDTFTRCMFTRPREPADGNE